MNDISPDDALEEAHLDIIGTRDVTKIYKTIRNTIKNHVAKKEAEVVDDDKFDRTIPTTYDITDPRLALMKDRAVEAL